MFDFWENSEVRGVAIFCLQQVVEVEMRTWLKLIVHLYMTVIHFLMLWKTKLEHLFGHYVLK